MAEKEISPPGEKPEGKPEKKTGTSADKVTETVELERRIAELHEKLSKKERTEENAKFLDDFTRELDALKTKIPVVAERGRKPVWVEWLDELDEIVFGKDN